MSQQAYETWELDLGNDQKNYKKKNNEKYKEKVEIRIVYKIIESKYGRREVLFHLLLLWTINIASWWHFSCGGCDYI